MDPPGGANLLIKLSRAATPTNTNASHGDVSVYLLALNALGYHADYCLVTVAHKCYLYGHGYYEAVAPAIVGVEPMRLRPTAQKSLVLYR